MRTLSPRIERSQPPDRITLLLPAAELVGEVLAARGGDVHRLIREAARGWPGGRRQRMMLTLAALEGARRAGGRP